MDALASGGDEGRGKAAKSFGEPHSRLRPGDVRMGKPGCGHAQSSYIEYIDV